MTLAARLLASAYPAVAIELWASSSGWDRCFRVYLFADPFAEPVWEGVEHPDIEAARTAASILAIANGNCAVFEILGE